LIGEPGLCERYRRALRLFDAAEVQTIEGTSIAGLWRIAIEAGLVQGGAAVVPAGSGDHDP
jgi:2-dehydro-3-deoxygalactonokinase